MANYVIKEMPTGMGNGSEGKTFPKMQVYTEFDYDKVIELVHTNSPAFSEATIRGVLDTLAVVIRELAKLVGDSQSGIKAKGAGSHKVWVRSI